MKTFFTILLLIFSSSSLASERIIIPSDLVSADDAIPNDPINMFECYGSRFFVISRNTNNGLSVISVGQEQQKQMFRTIVCDTDNTRKYNRIIIKDFRHE